MYKTNNRLKKEQYAKYVRKFKAGTYFFNRDGFPLRDNAIQNAFWNGYNQTMIDSVEGVSIYGINHEVYPAYRAGIDMAEEIRTAARRTSNRRYG
jgi:hypothetical protein